MSEKVKYVFRVDIDMEPQREMTDEEAKEVKSQFQARIELGMAATFLGLRPITCSLIKVANIAEDGSKG